MAAREHLVVVGNGMVSLRFLERLAEHAPDRFDVTVIGKEASPAYNRVLLSALLAGDVDLAGCVLRDESWYRSSRIRLLTGSTATAVDPATRMVSVDGRPIPFD